MADPKAAPAQRGAPASTQTSTYVDFLCLKLDPAVRHGPARERKEAAEEFERLLSAPPAGLEIRPYTAIGFRADVDAVLWLIAKDMELFQSFTATLLATAVGRHAAIPYAFLAVTKPSPYTRAHPQNFEFGPSPHKYLFLYPFTKTHAWYQLSYDKRRELMEQHRRAGEEFPDIKINTTYGFGISDHDFVLAFEGDDPRRFSDLVQRLRETEARPYTQNDLPFIPCIQRKPDELVRVLALA
jgi:chlorite dismutase